MAQFAQPSYNLPQGYLVMESALSGYTIIDLSREMAGSYACMMLGDMGASVIKLESPGDHSWRGNPPFHHWNRGKKSVALDLSVEEARGAFEAIVKSADVVVEDYLPGEARERGLDYNTLATLSPNLVYCAMPPFAEEGHLANKPGNDGVVSAYSGLMGNQNGPGRTPEYMTVPGPSCGAAFLAAYSIASALYVRETDGFGQKVEVPLLNGSVFMQGNHFIHRAGMAADLRGGQRDPRGVKPGWRLYECSDGKWIFIACGTDTFWGKLCIALDMAEFTVSPRFRDAPWRFEPGDEPMIKRVMDEKIGTETLNYWLQYFDENDVPAAPADTRDDFIGNPQVLSDSILVQVDDPDLGLTMQLGPLVTVDGMPGSVPAPAPGLGEHGVEVLLSLGYDEEECSRLARTGALIC